MEPESLDYLLRIEEPKLSIRPDEKLENSWIGRRTG
jgi:hypothetical protein